MRTAITIWIAVVVMLLPGALAVVDDDIATPGSPEDVSGTASVGPGVGATPDIKYLWVLPDESGESDTQLHVTPDGERNDIYACLVVGDEDSRDTIMDVFTDIYHPDGSFKYQVHATRLDPLEDAEEIRDCAADAVSAGLITVADEDLIEYNIFSQPNWYMYKVYLPMYYHQPCEVYEVKGYATDSTSRMSDAEVDGFDWLCGTYLELDFDTVDFGQIQPGAWKMKNGDMDMGTAGAPTLKNQGNTEVKVGVEFSDFVGTNGLPNKVITRFDSQLRNMVASSNYRQIPGEHIEFDSETLNWFTYPISLCRQEKIDFSIHAPVGIVPDTYTGQIKIYADPVVVYSPPDGAEFPVENGQTSA